MIDTQFPVVQPALFESLDDIQAAALGLLVNSGQSTSPRGMNTLEVLGAGFCLRNPRKRCVTVSARRWSLPLAIGEFCWHASGSDDVSPLEYYSRRWRAFADDASRIRGSCYGHTLFQKVQAGRSQWDRIVDVLREDPDSRRAIAMLASPTADADLTARDVACATSVQFFVRDHKLSALTNMRSNDAIWGLPYDVFLFTMLQELLAVTLNLDVGAYYHLVGSLHVYERHLELAKRILTDSGDPAFEMPPMRGVEQLASFLSGEEEIRRAATPPASPGRLLDPYWQNLWDVISWFSQWRVGRASEQPSGGGARESPYAGLLKNLMVEA